MRGRFDFPLTEEGIRQAECLASIATNWNISYIFTSPLKRAKDTAGTIGRELGIEPEINTGFHNIKLGEWEGKTVEWVKNKYPEEWKIWKETPENLKMPGFEPIDKIQKRACKAINEIIKNHEGENICVVSHRAVLKPLIAGLLDIRQSYYWKLRMDTASYSRIVYDGNIFYMNLFNQTEHLKRSRNDRL